MIQNKKDVHEFSLHWPDTSKLFDLVEDDAFFELNDDALYHRITRVLRLRAHETCILFDRRAHGSIELLACSPKNTLEFKLIKKSLNTIIRPSITFFLPLLKREALEHAVYSLVEVGAHEIQLMITHKTHQIGAQELERLHKIMIAAAEQSRSYAYALLHEPQQFEDIVASITHTASMPTFFFDPDGQDLMPFLHVLHAQKPEAVNLMVGPEGDLTTDEKNMLRQKQVQFCRLTPSVLRAQQAVAVSMGIFRSLLQ